MDAPRDASFLTFFILWARLQGWKIPPLHVRICHWLDTCADRVRVLLVFRGAAKSTIYAVYKAYKLYRSRSHRSLIYAADDKLAGKLTRDTLNVLRRHPLTGGMVPRHTGAMSFWVHGATDARNPSMEAVGVNSNATGSRADDADFDDIEVPKNIKTAEARLNLRQKIEEATHILVPGWQKTFVGTPHTHATIYNEQIEGGAAVLKIPLFEHVRRYTDGIDTRMRFRFDFEAAEDGLYVIAGIGKPARIMVDGIDYRVEGHEVVFDTPPDVVLDICAGCAWPDRFTREEIEVKRKETRTLNAWDSQYQLEAKPIEDVRLDPERMIPYLVEPEIRLANRRIAMYLGSVQVVGAVAYWDCSLGKVKSDASAFTVLFTDERGNLYWHVAAGLVGELDVLDTDGRLCGGQCYQILELVLKYQLPCVTVETNGPGGFVPPILRRAMAGTGCAVREEFSTTNKQARILDAFEPALSSRFLWAHESVLDGPVWDQMRDFNPASRNQPDDYLDSGAGAIRCTPVRIGKVIEQANGKNSPAGPRKDWAPHSGVHDVSLEDV